jgi:hypothetical protein
MVSFGGEVILTSSDKSSPVTLWLQEEALESTETYAVELNSNLSWAPSGHLGPAPVRWQGSRRQSGESSFSMDLFGRPPEATRSRPASTIRILDGSDTVRSKTGLDAWATPVRVSVSGGTLENAILHIPIGASPPNSSVSAPTVGARSLGSPASLHSAFMLSAARERSRHVAVSESR